MKHSPKQTSLEHVVYNLRTLTPTINGKRISGNDAKQTRDSNACACMPVMHDEAHVTERRVKKYPINV